MAKLIKCPRCQSLIDVTNMSPGNTVRCPDCGGMARIPTGQTGQHPRVPTPAPQPAAASAPREGGTRVRGRRAHGGRERTKVRRKSSNTGLVVGLSIAAVAVIAVLVALVATRKQPPPPVTTHAEGASDPGAATSTGVAVMAPGMAGAPAPVPVPPPPAPEPPKPSDADIAAQAADDASREDWDKIMGYLRSGGAFDDPERAEGMMFAKVKKMGKAAYPYVAKYIDHEELTMARAAVSVLNALTGQDKPLPNPTNRAQCKADWDAWIQQNK